MKTFPLFTALLLPLAVLAQATPLLSISDPEGDDVGAGALVYPRDSAFEPGDLDLRSLRAFAEDGGIRFEATLRNPIRDPAGVKTRGLGSEDLSQFARRGFYAFNLDIYLDTDRVAGSGNTVTLPGRRAQFDPAHGWEKAIVLTPRPELMRRQLRDALAQSSANVPAAEVDATLERSVFFATAVRVRGRTVSFSVPASFIDAPALAGASITALLTAAKLSNEAEVSLFGNAPANPLERITLGVAQPEAGRPELAMGYSSDRAPTTAVVDLLSPDPRQQAAQLAPGGLLTGLNRENQLGMVQMMTATNAAPAASTPSAVPAAAASGSWFSRALTGLATWFGSGTAASSAPAPAAAASASPQSLQSLLATPASTAAVPAAVAAPAAASNRPATLVPVAPAATAAAAPAAPPPSQPVLAGAGSKPRDAAFFEEQELRLRTLERLRKGGLITEAEFQQKRKEVLDLL